MKSTAFLLILAISKSSLAQQDYEYYEDDQPDTVLGYLMKEAVNQLQTEAAAQAASNEKEEVTEEASSSIFDALKEKIFEIETSSSNDDPVYNFIMVFSAIALFFQAFYTPFGKVSIKGRRKKRSSSMEEELGQAAAAGMEG